VKKKTREISIPYKFKPRGYQEGMFNCLADGYKRGVGVWHRRAGKEKTMWNLMIKESQKRVGTYYYLFPTYNQGKKIIWDGIDRAGFPYLDHIPPEIRKGKPNATEMKIPLKNGSLIQIIGTDNYNSIMGTNPIGCVFSEYSLQNPAAWTFIRPILTENEGWALFNFTPRGENHAYELYQMAVDNDRWYSELLTVDDTLAISKEAIRREIEDGMPEEMVQQEFYCSFSVAVPGAYFAKEMTDAQQQGRITRVPVDPNVPILTFWDLGVDDSTTIWLIQEARNELHVVHCYSNSGFGLVHYVNYLKDWRNSHNVTFDVHILPHDGRARTIQTGKTSVEVLGEYGFNCETTKRPQNKVLDGVEATRRLIPRLWFDKENCESGISALKQYRKEYVERDKVYKEQPVHDWSSHYADGLQTAALYYQDRGVITLGKNKGLGESNIYVLDERYSDKSTYDWMGN